MSLIKSLVHVRKNCINHPIGDTQETLHCFQCQKWLCSICLRDHSSLFNKHTLTPFEYRLKCSIHQLELVRYCSECACDICSECISSHDGHNLLYNSKMDTRELIQAYRNNIKWIMSQNDDLIKRFNVLASTKSTSLSCSNINEKEIVNARNDITSLFLMHKLMNQLLQEFLETLFNTVKLFKSHYNHNLDILSRSLQLNYSSIQLDQPDLNSLCFVMKEYYSNCFIVKQYNNNNDNVKLSPFVHLLRGHSDSIISMAKLTRYRLATGSKDKTIMIWNISTYELMNTLRGHDDMVMSIIQLDDNTLISSSLDQTIKVWDLNSYSCKDTLKGHRLYIKNLLKLTDDSFVSVSWNNFKVWSISSLQLLTSFQGHQNFVNCIIDINENAFATGSFDKTIKIWDKKEFKCIKTLSGHNDFVYSLIMIGTDLLVSGSRDTTIKLWDLNSYECVETLECSSPVIYLALLNNNILVSGCFDGSSTLWDYNSKKAIITNNPSVERFNSCKCILQLDYNTLAYGGNELTIVTFNN